MVKKYGGVKNRKPLNEIEEAVVYEKPPAHFTKTEIAGALLVVGSKLIPTVLLLMAVGWGFSFLVLKIIN